MVKAAADNPLIGRVVNVPKNVWPDFPCPNKKGWEGTITSLKGSNPEQYNVKFEGDKNVYYFTARQIKEWLGEPYTTDEDEESDEGEALTHSEEFHDPVELEEVRSPKKKTKTSKKGAAGPSKSPTKTKGKRVSQAEAIEDLNKVAKRLRVNQLLTLVASAKDMLKH